MMAIHSSADFHMCLVIYWVVSLFICISSGLERQLVATYNPGCTRQGCNDTVEVVHVRADGPNDTLHYVWCFQNKPTILIALTSHAANMSVDWDAFPNMSSISFTSQPEYSFGVLFNKIFEFNDTNDDGIMNVTNYDPSYILGIEMPDSWEMKRYEQNLDSVLLVMDGSWNNSKSCVKGGTFRVELETFRTQDYGHKLPHLLHSPNATQIELSFLGMVTDPPFPKNRFAVELVLAANESSTSEVIPKSLKSLDDEHSPGVFTLVDLQTSASRDKGNGAYLQWRPVAYVAGERDIVNSTETALYNVTNSMNSSSDFEGTLLNAFFGESLNRHLLSAVNVSFGAKDDGFYSENNVTIWAATIGYGHPPDETFSLLVLLIIGICLGLPAVLIVLSGFYIALRRISHRKDDLFLAH